MATFMVLLRVDVDLSAALQRIPRNNRYRLDSLAPYADFVKILFQNGGFPLSVLQVAHACVRINPPQRRGATRV
jgi:hypothetical protein